MDGSDAVLDMADGGGEVGLQPLLLEITSGEGLEWGGRMQGIDLYSPGAAPNKEERN
jgi:hypothetical protein